MKRAIQTDQGLIQVGTKVICNGYPGTVVVVHEGQLAGMIDVRLDRGDVCVSANDARTIQIVNQGVPHEQARRVPAKRV
jgi:hypothetical protein